jgi:hypothetical protein
MAHYTVINVKEFWTNEVFSEKDENGLLYNILVFGSLRSKF